MYIVPLNTRYVEIGGENEKNTQSRSVVNSWQSSWIIDDATVIPINS